LSLEIEMFFD